MRSPFIQDSLTKLTKGCLSFLLIVIPAVSAAKTFDYSADTPSAKAVVEIKTAIEKGQLSQVPALRQQVGNDTLAIYADYWMAERAVQKAQSVFNVPEATAFLNKYPDSYAAEKLKASWVLAAFDAGAFTKIRDIGEFEWLNKQVRCAKLEARHMTGPRATQAEALSEFAPGQACWSMLQQFVADGVVSRDELVALMQDAIERNNTQTASRLAALTFDPQTLGKYQAMMKAPSQWVRGFKGNATGDDAVIVAIGLQRMARDNLKSTGEYVEQTWRERLPKAELGWVWGQLAFRAALDLGPQADQWYRLAGDSRLSEVNHPWRVRMALRQPKIDWQWVQTAIDRMPPQMQQEADWQYWRARALSATGQEDQARAIYQGISGQYNFYGQLALEELGQLIVAPAAPPPLSQRELQAARDNPHLQQGVALFRLGLRREAVPQWNFALRNMNDRELLATAEFARELGIYDRVVNTSERTQNTVDFAQRFIAPFKSEVVAQAQSINLDPAWVYGLIRQESRFIMDARSVVGASGLMQLMPATAKYVAQKIGMTNFSPSRVNEFEINTKLGTNYLQMVLNDLGGSQVLASAGYNAGPGRPAKWRSTLVNPVEGAIFAETIPFTETRDYVKSVLSNATYYEATFSGQPQSLKERLGRITPR
jgi:soluble lytic murein transglycosylase